VLSYLDVALPQRTAMIDGILCCSVCKEPVMDWQRLGQGQLLAPAEGDGCTVTATVQQQRSMQTGPGLRACVVTLALHLADVQCRVLVNPSGGHTYSLRDCCGWCCSPCCNSLSQTAARISGKISRGSVPADPKRTSCPCRVLWSYPEQGTSRFECRVPSLRCACFLIAMC
jgi:hypothetical protein